jgi:outer membrane biosynthesis protein TonB
MRAGLLLPACIILSALVHVLLVAAVAVPRHATSHGESITVDIVPANEVPDLPEVPESTPETPPLPVPDQQAQQAAAPPPPPPSPAAPQQAEPRKPEPPRQQVQQKPQQPPPQQQAQPQQPPPQQQASQPWPEQPQQEPATPAPGSTLAEQQERLMAMLNLQGPGAGDGSGAEAETKAHLTEQEKNPFKAHLKSCWQLPPGVSPNQKLKVIVRMSLKQNGSLAGDPQLIEAGISPIGPPLVQAAINAIKQCAPYTMLPDAKYKEWRILDINFSPDEMAKG